MSENITKNPLKRMQEIGASEIANATHIEVEYINYIIEKNFDKLKDKNVKAFVKIIERECDVDLKVWFDEYRAYFMDDLDKEDSSKFASLTKKEEIVIKDHNNLPKYLLFIVFLVIVGWAVFNFKLYDLNSFFSENNSTEINYSTNSAMIEEAGGKLEKTGIEVTKIEKLEPKNDLNALEKLTLVESKEENLTINLEDENLTIKTSNDDENLSIEESVTLEKSNIKGASITPTDKIWIGVINIKTGKKETITTKDEYKFDLEKEQLILTGHGLFTLSDNGKIEKFNDKNPHRFYIKDGKVKQISYEEFLGLNKGKAW